MAISQETPQVLVVDDESELAELYSYWLSDEYDVLTATSGEEALESISEETHVVLLDRRMPSMTGDEVLEAIRERGVDCRVAMITAVEPDVDIVEMPFDDYLVKPVTREALSSIVAVLLRRSTFDDRTQEFFSLASKKVTLEEAGDIDTEESDEYAELTDDLQTLQSELNDTLVEFSTEDFEDAFRSLDDENAEFRSTPARET